MIAFNITINNQSCDGCCCPACEDGFSHTESTCASDEYKDVYSSTGIADECLCYKCTSCSEVCGEDSSPTMTCPAGQFRDSYTDYASGCTCYFCSDACPCVGSYPNTTPGCIDSEYQTQTTITGPNGDPCTCYGCEPCTCETTDPGSLNCLANQTPDSWVDGNGCTCWYCKDDDCSCDNPNYPYGTPDNCGVEEYEVNTQISPNCMCYGCRPCGCETVKSIVEANCTGNDEQVVYVPNANCPCYECRQCGNDCLTTNRNSLSCTGNEFIDAYTSSGGCTCYRCGPCTCTQDPADLNGGAGCDADQFVEWYTSANGCSCCRCHQCPSSSPEPCTESGYPAYHYDSVGCKIYDNWCNPCCPAGYDTEPPAYCDYYTTTIGYTECDTPTCYSITCEGVCTNWSESFSSSIKASECGYEWLATQTFTNTLGVPARCTISGNVDDILTVNGTPVAGPPCACGNAGTCNGRTCGMYESYITDVAIGGTVSCSVFNVCSNRAGVAIRVCFAPIPL